MKGRDNQDLSLTIPQSWRLARVPLSPTPCLNLASPFCCLTSSHLNAEVLAHFTTTVAYSGLWAAGRWVPGRMGQVGNLPGMKAGLELQGHLNLSLSDCPVLLNFSPRLSVPRRVSVPLYVSARLSTSLSSLRWLSFNTWNAQ